VKAGLTSFANQASCSSINLGVVLDGRDPGRSPAAARHGRGVLLRGQAGDEAERPEHLLVLLVPGRDFAHRPLARLRQVEEDPEAQPLA
jgi:hypothetical protein